MTGRIFLHNARQGWHGHLHVLRLLAACLVFLLAAASCELPIAVTTNGAPAATGTAQPGEQPPAAGAVLSPAPASTATQDPAGAGVAAGQPQAPTETSQPGKTPLPVLPTAAEEAQAIISKDNLSNAPTADVIRELGLFVGGAGAGMKPCTTDVTQPAFVEPLLDMEKMGFMTIITCGWQENEPVRVTVTDSNGGMRDLGIMKAVIDPSKDDQAYGVSFEFRTWPEDPVGTYTYTLEGASGKIEAQAAFVASKGPQIFALSPEEVATYTGKPASAAGILFIGFAPEEKLNLLVYHINQVDEQGAPMYSLVGQMELSAGSSGTRLVPTNLALKDTVGMILPEYMFTALGEKSGEVHLYRINSHGYVSDVLYDLNVFCAGAPQPLMTYNTVRQQTFQVVIPDGQTLPVYTNGGSGDLVGAVANGAMLAVRNSPKCSNGVWWWPVDLGEGAGGGFVPEMLNGQYVLVVANP